MLSHASRPRFVRPLLSRIRPATLLAFALPTWAFAAQVLTNPGFETAPFPSGWTSSGTTSVTGLNGSSTAARLPYNTTATLNQAVSSTPSAFTLDVSFSIAGNNEPQAFRVALETAAGSAIEVRTTTTGALQVNWSGTWRELARISDGSSFSIPANQAVRLRLIGRNFGTANAEYDVAWSDPGATALTHAAVGLRVFAVPNSAAAGGINHIRFDRNVTSANSFVVDDVLLEDSAVAPPTADHQLAIIPEDKVVKISGVYPHLAMTSFSDECGVGAVVPWAGKLWTMTYAPHMARGSDDKLFEIAPDLSRVIRPESIGGTPANRFIHTPSNQLIIGPYFIDGNGTVRKMSYTLAPGRYTATAAHLTDPANRIYMFTMEDGLYDVNVNDLSFTTIYPDVQGMGDNHLSGYHGKGAYTGQGLLVVANNGEPNQTFPSGVLATWDGTLPHKWNELFRVQHCEVTGPGGLSGNKNPATDPIWATGFDAKSVVLRTLEGGTWHTWRLPKGSYTHDGAHGWHTEWPRIREIEPGTTLMHMHGLFFDFPETFSSSNFSGLSPICSYYKMPTDYCMWEGQLVMGKNDTSKFSNALVKKAQSNLWFGQLEDLNTWGAPQGHGSLWLAENVTANTASEPFLVHGFTQGTLHLRHTTGSPVNVEIQTSNGTGSWNTLRTVTVPASGYAWELINDLGVQWVRLKTGTSATQLTASFLLSNPYPHRTPPSVVSEEFAALADIRDTKSFSEGILRVTAGNDLKLEVAPTRVSDSGTVAQSGYYQIGGPMNLDAVNNSTAETTLRTEAALTQDFGSDQASAWVTVGAEKLRLPKFDPEYDKPFAAGWARGFREVVTERQMLNCQGTFYEVPRDNSGGRRRMRPLATHGKRISDYASWRGLLVLTGVLDSALASKSLLRPTNGGAALWLGEVDDIWRMGEPRGVGGPWLNTAVTASAPSDAYLMYGYNHKELKLSHEHAGAVNFTVEVDFLGDNTWSPYARLTVAAGQTLKHLFPAGFHAHWVRVSSDTSTTATAQFTYGPTQSRDALLDWSREHGIPTGAGRPGIAANDDDGDGVAAPLEFVFGTDPKTPEPMHMPLTSSRLTSVLRQVVPEDGVQVTVLGSSDLQNWEPRPDLEITPVSQAGVPEGFTRREFDFDRSEPAYFLKLQVNVRQ